MLWPVLAVFSLALVVDATLIVAAYFYSRFIFSGYLRKHHPRRWEEMVYTQEYSGVNLLSFDKTPALHRFRCESTDNLGDPYLSRMRRLSIRLFNVAMIAWLGIVGILIIGGVLSVLVLR